MIEGHCGASSPADLSLDGLVEITLQFGNGDNAMGRGPDLAGGTKPPEGRS